MRLFAGIMGQMLANKFYKPDMSYYMGRIEDCKVTLNLRNLELVTIHENDRSFTYFLAVEDDTIPREVLDRVSRFSMSSSSKLAWHDTMIPPTLDDILKLSVIFSP